VSCVEDRLPELVGVQLAHGGSDWGSNGYREPTRPTARWQHSDPRQRERTDYEKGLLDYSAVAILLLATMSQYALARGGGSHGGSGHGGGFHGGGFHGFGGGGFRGAGFGGGLRGFGGPRASFAAVGPGFRGSSFGGRGFPSASGRWIGPGRGWARRAGWQRGGWRRGWGWGGGALALGIGFGWDYYDAYYDNGSCLAWNGYRWVNTCWY
jgi:hypothetical protein